MIPPGDLRLKHKVFVIALAPDEYEGLTEIQYRGKFSVTVPASAGTAGQGRWAIIVQREGRKRTITHLGFARSTGRVSSIDRRITVEPIEGSRRLRSRSTHCSRTWPLFTSVRCDEGRTREVRN
ncbi:hypothetical protein G5V59_12950 [Nocardioides sp. W3-2-3]|uniref:hypothetical protein n=1 Tax=Nocardioides convexus TaxID=2712224 RepID=UPI00241833BE|nr:hypothetical protein [Nocardioides convexus]NHA00622.1 hypothetical protein [Nocardioides convexus]